MQRNTGTYTHVPCIHTRQRYYSHGPDKILHSGFMTTKTAIYVHKGCTGHAGLVCRGHLFSVKPGLHG